MNDFLRTKAGLQVVETITRHLPRITDALEEIALGLNYLRRLENDERKKEALDNRMKEVMTIKGDNNGKEKQEDVWSSHENANR